MDHRLARENASKDGDIEMFPKIHNRESLEKAILLLEDFVKNGSFYHAAELSDWISYVAKDLLTENDDLERRLKIERLKRLSYLGYKSQVVICRDEICKSYDFETFTNIKSDEIKFYLFTAIGLTLWRIGEEDDSDEFDKHFRICYKLYKKLNDNYTYKNIVKAFFGGLLGRMAYLKDKPLQTVMRRFEDSLEFLTENERKTRVFLHLIIYYIEHLLSLYEREYILEIKSKIDELFKRYESMSNVEDTPLKTILQIRFLVLKFLKLKKDIDYLQSGKTNNYLNVRYQFNHAKADLITTAILLGFGNLQYCPPLIDRIKTSFEDEQILYDTDKTKQYIKGILKEIDWKGMEAVAATYFRQCGYEVEVLGARETTFDLLLKNKAPYTLITSANEQPATATGVQVKHWKKGLKKDAFDKWKYKAANFKRKNEITHVIFFVTNKPDCTIDEGKHEVLSLPRFVPPVYFISLDDAVNMFWKHPGCLPAVYRTILDQQEFSAKY